MTLTQDVVEAVFGVASNGPLVRVPAAQQAVPVDHTEKIDEYAISGAGAAYCRKLRVAKTGLAPHAWQNQFQKVAYQHYARLGKLHFDALR